MFGMGCFWGAEKKFWQLHGVYTHRGRLRRRARRPNPTYREVCTGMTGHNEVVLVVFDPQDRQLRRSAEGVLGEPRSDAGHAAGQRRRHAVPLGDLRRRRPAAARRRSVAGRVSEAADRGRLRRDYHRDRRRRRSSTTPRTTTSSTSRRTPTATAASAAPASAVRSGSRRQRDDGLPRDRRDRREQIALRSLRSPRCFLALIPLPIDPFVDEIVDRVRRSRAVVVTAAPGAGKTTRVPPALLGRRPGHPAAAAAGRRAGDRRAHRRRAGLDARPRGRLAGPLRAPLPAETRLLVATEGILTARLQTRSAALRLSRRSSSTSSTSAACTPTWRWRWRGRPGARATICESS